MSGGGVFSRTALWVVIPVAALSLIVTAALTIFGDDLGSRPSAGADAYSHSALGYHALVEILERLDVPVVVSRADSAAKARSGVLVIAEPVLADTDPDAGVHLHDEVTAARRVLLVLPKWYGIADRAGRWVQAADLVPTSDVQPLLDAVGVTAAIDRRDRPPTWAAGALPAPALDDPQVLTQDDDQLDPMVWTSDRAILLGKTHVGETELWVLADPDVLDNAGLRDPANARLAIALLDELRAGGPVVFDEASHGFAESPSLGRALLRFPLVLGTLQFAICALLVVWAAMVRFGPLRAAPPPLRPGKDFLIRNTAALLRYGGHHGDALRRYLAATVVAVRHALHAPADLAPGNATVWLERIRVVRGGTVSLPELEAAIDAAGARPPPHRVVELADLVYRWRKEMTHGSAHRS